MIIKSSKLWFRNVCEFDFFNQFICADLDLVVAEVCKLEPLHNLPFEIFASDWETREKSFWYTV